MRSIIFLLFISVTCSIQSQDFLAECDTKRDELAQEGKDLKTEFRKNMNEANRGMICSQCGNTKNELEKSGRETFDQHLTRVDGVAIQPTASDIQRKQNELKSRHNQQIDRINQRIDKNNKDCRRKVKEWNEEQNRIAEEKKQAEEQKKLDAAKAEQDMLDKMRKEQEAIEAENERKRQEQLTIAKAKQIQAEADLLNDTKTLMASAREGSNANVLAEKKWIREQEEKIANMNIGKGLSENNDSSSFDSDKMNDAFSDDFTYDDDDFFAEEDFFSVTKDKASDWYRSGNELFDNAKEKINGVRDVLRNFGEDYWEAINVDAVQVMAENMVENYVSSPTKNLIGRSFSLAQMAENAREFGNSFGDYVDNQMDDFGRLTDYMTTFDKSEQDPYYDPNGFWDRTETRTKEFICDNMSFGFCSTLRAINQN